MMTVYGLNRPIEASRSILRSHIRARGIKCNSTYLYVTACIIYILQSINIGGLAVNDVIERHEQTTPSRNCGPGIEALAGNPLRHPLEPRRHDVTHHEFMCTSTLISEQNVRQMNPSHIVAQLLQAPSLYTTVHYFLYNQTLKDLLRTV